MFENPRRGRQARNFTTNAPKILDLKSSFEQIFSRNLPLGAPVFSSVLLMPVIILCLKGVVKLCKTRHRTRTLPISCELSLFNFDADNEEHVIFDVTAL